MYEKFYGLTADPFRLSPDHRFSFSHASYAKAKAYIRYALQRGEGLVMVTGKPGTGKTTLINDLLTGLPQAEAVVATLVSTQLEADDLLRMVAYSFGLSADAPQKALVLQRLMDFLGRQYREGRRALLIIDEAQDLSISALEELRLLTNLQRAGQPLLQIVLLGQESLRDLVRRPDMQQVHQRIVAACDLEPLGRTDTLAYVGHRLEKAGWRGDPSFEREAWPILYGFCQGIPRRINLVCSRLLLHGSVEDRHTLTAEDAALVVGELQREELGPTEPWVDSEFLYALVSQRSPSSQRAGGIPGRVEEEAGDPRGMDTRPASLDRLEDYLDEDIARKLEGRREVTSIAGEAELSWETQPAVESDIQESSALIQGEEPDRVSSPRGQYAPGDEAAEEEVAEGRSHIEDALQENAGRRPDRFRDRCDEAAIGLGTETAYDSASELRPDGRSDGSPREMTAHTVNARVRASHGEGETGGCASGSDGDEWSGADRPGRTWWRVVSLVTALLILVAAVLYFRPNALAPELAWFARQVAAIPQTASSVFAQLTGTDGTRRHDGAGGRVGGEVSEAGRTDENRDESAETRGGGTAKPPAPPRAGGTGEVEE